MRLIQATIDLKNEKGRWSVIVTEPPASTGIVKLCDVSTYDFLVHMHSYVSRDRKCTNDNITVDFAHKGPVFPVWHRRYLLIVEKEYQRIMNHDYSFGLPYWQWEIDDRTPFKEEYFGMPSNSYEGRTNVTGTFGNPQNWSTICDLPVIEDNPICKSTWKPCNPEEDHQRSNESQRTLKRGKKNPNFYLPHFMEVEIAIAAPEYDTVDDSSDSFRQRLEGLYPIC